MKPFPREIPINPGDFASGLKTPKTKFGLPAEVAYCKNCAITNQRPISAMEYKHTADSKKKVIGFDENGVCDACHVAAMKRESVDWAERERMLRALCDRYRRDDGQYDCIVPGSGGKDSFVQAHLLKHKYGMNPLTVTWAPHIFTDWGWRNLQKWIHAGFDNYLFTPNGRVHRLLTRLSTEVLFHPFQPFILGQKGLAMRMALQFKIPLIFYGDHASEWGTPKEDFAKSHLSWNEWVVKDDEERFIGGTSIATLKSDFGLSDNDLLPYQPVDMDSVVNGGLEVHFMGFYEKWHPQQNYYYAAEHGGFEPAPERSAGTYSRYSSIDDKMDDFNFYTSFIKFGYGRAMMDSSQEVRSGDIEREEALHLIRRYDGEYPERFEKEVFTYLSIPDKEFPVASRMFEQPIMTREYFAHLADRFRSPHIWEYVGNAWRLRNPVH